MNVQMARHDQQWGVPLDEEPAKKPVAVIVQVIPHVVYPWDPAVVRAIREFDRGYVPVWIQHVFRTQAGGEYVEGFHAVATHERYLDGPVPRFMHTALMPTLGTLERRLERPNVIHMHLRHLDRGAPIPGMFANHDWGLYNYLVAIRNEMTAAQRQQWLNENDGHAQAERAREKANADAEQATKDDRVWLRRKLGELTEDDKRLQLWRQTHPGEYDGPRSVNVQMKEAS